MRQAVAALAFAALAALAVLAAGCDRRAARLRAQENDGGAAPPGAPSSAEAAAPPSAAAPPARGTDLSLVAVGKASGAKILWLTAHGTRVWLSGRNVDAVADGDGPLAKTPDPLGGLPYQAGKHALRVAGMHPHLYALRYEPPSESAPAGPANAAVFVRGPDGWTAARPLPRRDVPVAFLPWGEGALVVTSQDGPGEVAGDPSYDPARPGTTLAYVAPDGSVSDPKLAIPRPFLAFDAHSDGATLALLGTVVHEGRGGRSYAIHALRGDATRALDDRELFTTPHFAWAALHRAHIREVSGAALALAPSENNELAAWKPNSQTFYVVDGAGASRLALPLRTGLCGMRDAVRLDGDFLVLDSCPVAAVPAVPTSQLWLLHGQGRSAVHLPALAKDAAGYRVAGPGDVSPLACEPRKLLLRAPDDLWIQAECGTGRGDEIPAVFRRGRPQAAAILLP